MVQRRSSLVTGHEIRCRRHQVTSWVCFSWTLEVQPFFIGWFTNHRFLSRGLSSSKGTTIFVMVVDFQAEDINYSPFWVGRHFWRTMLAQWDVPTDRQTSSSSLYSLWISYAQQMWHTRQRPGSLNILCWLVILPQVFFKPMYVNPYYIMTYQ